MKQVKNKEVRLSSSYLGFHRIDETVFRKLRWRRMHDTDYTNTLNEGVDGGQDEGKTLHGGLRKRVPSVDAEERA